MATLGRYSKAYPLGQLRQFCGWTEKPENARQIRKEVDGEIVAEARALTDEDYVYVHRNFIVTDGIFVDENIIFCNVTPQWIEFCQTILGLENLNAEPERAEVHYLAHTVEECRPYFNAIQSEAFGWAFTVNHAHLVPEGIGGFLDAFGVARIGEVRLADRQRTRGIGVRWVGARQALEDGKRRTIAGRGARAVAREALRVSQLLMRHAEVALRVGVLRLARGQRLPDVE